MSSIAIARPLAGARERIQLREAVVVYRPLALTLEGSALRVGSVMRESSEFGAVARAWIGDRTQEHIVAFALDDHCRVIGANVIGVGASARVALCVTELLRFLLASGATALVLAHNHPSGEVSPSPEDLALTLEVARGCEAVGMKCLDHVIVGAGARRVFSFHDEGLMP